MSMSANMCFSYIRPSSSAKCTSVLRFEKKAKRGGIKKRFRKDLNIFSHKLTIGAMENNVELKSVRDNPVDSGCVTF